MSYISKEIALLTLVANSLIFVGLLLHCNIALPDGHHLFFLATNTLTLTDFLLTSGVALHLCMHLDTWLDCPPEDEQLMSI